MEILAKSENKIKFVIDNIDHVIANTLRRAVMTQVPVMAIKEINVIKNNSGLYDEILAHRMGLIPLKTDLTAYNLPSECKCKGNGCALCQVNLTIDVKGPCTIYSSDLKSDDPKVVPVYDKMPLTKLNDKNQALKIEAVATLGIGKEHAKFSPGLMFYQAYPSIKVENKLENVKNCKEVCPTNVYEVEGDKLKVKNLLNCTLCNACSEIAEPEGSINVESSKTKFIFTLESWGQLEEKELMKEAFKAIEKNLSELEKEIKKIK